MLRSPSFSGRHTLSLDRVWIDRILFFIAVAIIVGVTAGPSSFAGILRFVLN